MPTRNINFTGYYDEFVNELITSGRFSSASEVMRAGLRLLSRPARTKLTFARSWGSRRSRVWTTSTPFRCVLVSIPAGELAMHR